jgi:hypothetical protein
MMLANTTGTFETIAISKIRYHLRPYQVMPEAEGG